MAPRRRRDTTHRCRARGSLRRRRGAVGGHRDQALRDGSQVPAPVRPGPSAGRPVPGPPLPGDRVPAPPPGLLLAHPGSAPGPPAGCGPHGRAHPRRAWAGSAADPVGGAAIRSNAAGPEGGPPVSSPPRKVCPLPHAERRSPRCRCTRAARPPTRRGPGARSGRSTPSWWTPSLAVMGGWRAAPPPAAGRAVAATAYRLVHDELMLDGNSRLNLATFVTTWMEPQADA